MPIRATAPRRRVETRRPMARATRRGGHGGSSVLVLWGRLGGESVQEFAGPAALRAALGAWVSKSLAAREAASDHQDGRRLIQKLGKLARRSRARHRGPPSREDLLGPAPLQPLDLHLRPRTSVQQPGRRPAERPSASGRTSSSARSIASMTRSTCCARPPLAPGPQRAAGAAQRLHGRGSAGRAGVAGLRCRRRASRP